ncbi:helix-turn-helix domain-containing protein [Thiohalophilus thiocyanatoxydans]|uniref:Helix-turn-helix protein n=1 Tax=Thiohalophilus thiocyanatoxydans TaxID=381308 RepID=A0A4R8ILP6_9GAMM|nr:helix-turn-helix domain-containing protein [Thiohalophilus thiocyanatoxydans]TDY01732.1 helix-turn-helix protein [Thiohalophilus thiocyanatoxydans]
MTREALHQPEMPPAEPRIWPGQRLREAREAQNLSREQVAHQLNQEVSTIAALEEDDYARLPGKTYILGYLRSYARLLQLPENEIIDAVQIDREENRDLLPGHLNSDKPIPLTTRNRRPLRYVILIILIIVALVGLFVGVPSLPFALDWPF